MASLARIVRTAVPRSTRAFSAATVARKDIVQDLYLAQLKSYKPKPQVQDAHVGIVREYKAPAVAAATALPSDLASELATYDASQPDLADAVPVKTSAHVDAQHGGPMTAEEFLEMLEADPVEVAHH
ncbi:hypothetical protein DACRYDRAFT_23176 [Dacryopinax primogenitus]|uniref:ATP synthase complex subunit H-domain-containing protein n=1 Tax=Dacryopinax primogenitus (strain DJM 731) TaxID=1858805 RepID=M5FWY5_DACPD|nr:uncharacterized protein DACRYDRAFT_23176 [Dacryopinax primogenitus]EJU00190.1 hypothetical protein DACRYDRAFT_23176 [Dacryopinax primogenitus]